MLGLTRFLQISASSFDGSDIEGVAWFPRQTGFNFRHCQIGPRARPQPKQSLAWDRRRTSGPSAFKRAASERWISRTSPTPYYRGIIEPRKVTALS
jgi:hypothetical protein